MKKAFPSGNQNQKTGEAGERAGAEFLAGRGYRILGRNVKTPLGEIDLVAEERGTLVFVEIKTRRSARFGAPEEAVHGSKQRRLSRLALWYSSRHLKKDQPIRFDVLAVDSSGEKPSFHLIQNAFEASV